MTTETSLMGSSAFSVAPNDFRIVHPLSASPASSFFPPNNCSPPPSQPQHHASSGISSNPEDVTTIFVVGFPDDMLEREFQNMFTFSPGFEAASLKWHCKDQDDENTSTPITNTSTTINTAATNTTTITTPSSSSSFTNNTNSTNNNNNNSNNNSNSNNNGLNAINMNNGIGKKQMIGFARFRTRLEAMEAVEVLSGKRIDNDKGSVLKAEMAKKNLHIKRGSIVPNAHPSISGGSSAAAAAAAAAAAQQQQQQQTQHHSQQSSSQHPLHQTPSQIQHSQHNIHQHHIHQQQPPQHHHHHHHQAVVAAAAAAAAAETGSSPLSILSRKMSLHPPPTAYDTFSPLPSDLLSPADYKTDPFNDHPLANGSSTPTTSTSNSNCLNTSTAAISTSLNSSSNGGFNDSFFNLRSQSFDARSNDLVVSPRAFSLYPRPTNRVGIQGLVQQQQDPSSAVPTAVPGAIDHQHQHPNHNHQHHQPQQHQHQQHDPFNYLSKSSPVVDNRLTNGNSSSFFESAVANGHISTDILSSRMNSLLINNNNNNNNSNNSNGTNNNNNITTASTPTGNGPSTPTTATGIPSPTNFRGSISNSNSNNPADQNPPCNTLYVGNLPPFTSEDELRQLFSKCINFKRLLFRSKNQQGPMCFVEFDDVVYATQAMNELQGHTLSNSVKGGIRLSFSKNPLFTKPNGPNSTMAQTTTTTTTTTTSSSNSSSSISNSSNSKKGGDSFMFDLPM